MSEKKKEKTTSNPLPPPPNPNRVVPVDTQLKYCIKYVKSMIVYQKKTIIIILIIIIIIIILFFFPKHLGQSDAQKREIATTKDATIQVCDLVWVYKHLADKRRKER